ncbi:hypothetical protein EJ05DRAFT_505670 [Pseudovirgaria hyperparasitica]|uniref:Tat pathway signal sequence n=1 Tax=Pseudovirgaria hyperparasitica TaxID=470096 RepID=A0A6A6VU71_9PEZI|nr:uncharacterized protein EJ05DRAFT_505670 [Pseudovirgaria hyperparasitica]KAF2752791.1 hypothetical protein EJ05DRAFT_505670 [Pseudovirgaria hyperparasitica]
MTTVISRNCDLKDLSPMLSKWLKPVKEVRYAPANDEEPSLFDKEDRTSINGKRLEEYSRLLWQCICICMFFYGAIVQWYMSSSTCSIKECLRQTALWSPILDSVEYELYNFSSSDLYNGPPTPERERNWKALEAMPPVFIPKASITLLNRSTESKLLKSGDNNKNGYIGTIEVFHHLHCLNSVRQYVWQDQYPKDLRPSFLEHNESRAHVSHCISTLRQALMCNADLTPYLWYEGEDGGPAKEDFGAAHQCKRFDSIVSATLRHGTRFPDGTFG